MWKRALGFFVAIALWWMSMKFSVNGFGADISTNPQDAWMGWVLALAVTAYELIWNSMKDKTNPTLFWVGMAAYSYGIGTNVLGIMAWRGLSFKGMWETLSTTGDVFTIIGVILSFLFCLVLSFVIEVTPEPTITWAVTGRVDDGDFLGNLIGNHIPSKSFSSFMDKKPDNRSNNKQSEKSSYQPQHKPSQMPPMGMPNPNPQFSGKPTGNRPPTPNGDGRPERVSNLVRDVDFTEEPTYR